MATWTINYQLPKASPSNLDFRIFILYDFLTDSNFEVVDKRISKCWPCLGFLSLGFVYHNSYFSLKKSYTTGQEIKHCRGETRALSAGGISYSVVMFCLMSLL